MVVALIKNATVGHSVSQTKFIVCDLVEIRGNYLQTVITCVLHTFIKIRHV